MAGLYEQLEKAKKLKPRAIEKDIFSYIRKLESFIIDLNKTQIEIDSKDIHGKAIGFYSEATEVLSGGKKKAGDPFTGVDTEDWFNAFYMFQKDGAIGISSKDPKNAIILSNDKNNPWLSKDLFGLSDENLEEAIRTKILPYHIEHSRKILDI